MLMRTLAGYRPKYIKFHTYVLDTQAYVWAVQPDQNRMCLLYIK